MKNILSTLFMLSISFLQAQITLTHNVGTTPIGTDMYSCERDEGWSRVFRLSDFDIAANEQFVIKSGQVALSKSNSGAFLQFNVYSIDDNFPVFFHSLYPRTLLGSRGIGQAPNISGAPEIVQVEFEEPIIVPAGVERILVSVKKIEDFYNPESAQVFIAGTEEDTGVSWYEGCEDNYSLTPTTDLTIPVPEANFYINVTGEVFSVKTSGATTRLSHNVCDDIIETNIHSCTSSYIYWARAFTLEEFGISANEEYVVTSGQVGINKTGWLPEIRFNIYKIDDNFPASFSETDLIGSSQYQQLSPNIDRTSQIIQVDFETPIVIPADVGRILVEVHKGIVYGDGVAFIAGSVHDNGVSWQRGCTNVAGGTTFDYNEYVSTADFGRPDANFYINVTGNVNHVTNNFEMNISNICSEFLKEFSVEQKENVASVVWDFGDPNSGVNNTSTDMSPFHDFSADGTYTITATVTGNDASVEVLTETIDVKEPPTAYGIDNVYACEDVEGTGFSSSFDVSGIYDQVLGGQTGKIVKFVDGAGNEYNVLPSPFANSIKDRETITVRVSHQDNPCCYSETTFDLIVNPMPDLNDLDDLYECDDNYDGVTQFNLLKVKHDILGGATNLQVVFFYEDGQSISDANLQAVENKKVDIEELKVVVTNTDTGCSAESTFSIIVDFKPRAFDLTDLLGCDDNNDGISEYFNTSNIETEVMGNQSGMEISYFDASGGPLPSPLPNPFKNTEPFQQVITVRVKSPVTECYAETTLVLRTSDRPQIYTPQDIYECDEGEGFAGFDLSGVENTITGGQSDMNVFYYDDAGNDITNEISANYQNTEPWVQTIHVKVENALSPLCVSETRFNLIVNALPEVNLASDYFLCNLEPSLYLSVEDGFGAYAWQFQDGSIISNSFEATLFEAGHYSLTVGRTENALYCEDTFHFELVRSVLPKITEVTYQELSDNNFITIIANGDGDFEYSIDGINYQDSNTFEDVLGGVYTVYVRDKLGCGDDSQNVTLIDYPKFFTPNGDGVNDYWQVRGITDYPDAEIYIYDRYGKLLKQLSPQVKGWDGTYGGENMANSDYWFVVNLHEGPNFTGHFSLKR
ncbi:T9SS type B sorting domain-containing protein [Snuella lapsa]